MKFLSLYIQVANLMNLIKMKLMSYKFNLILIRSNVSQKLMKIFNPLHKQILNPHFNRF